MRNRTWAAALAFLLITGGVACNRTARGPDVEKQINQSLDAAGLRDVKADQDRDKGVVTLKGEVQNEGDKAKAEEIAKSEAAGQVVANEIAVRIPGQESEMKTTDSALDDGIEDNYKAAITRNHLDDVKYDAKEGVITLSGTVATEAQRQQAEKLAASIPNVKQVVNTIEVSGGKATATTTRK